MPWSQGNIQETGFEIVLSNFEAFQDTFYDVIHSETKWQDVIPMEAVLDTLPPGATSTSYGVRDWSGQGAFLKSDSNIPVVGLSYRKDTPIRIHAGGVGGVVTREDIRNYAYAHGGGLDTELTAIMGMACDKHVERVVFYGDESLAMSSWMNYPGVEVIQAPLNSASTSRAWADKTPDEILKDINLVMSTVRRNTEDVFVPGEICLPGDQFDDISTRPMGDNADKSVMDYVKRKNVYSMRTGNDLVFKSIHHLHEAGAGGVQRAVFQTRERPKECFGLPFPIKFTLLPPQIIGFETKFLAEYKFGSFYKPRPETAIYLDEI